jgi:hypothetical protein
MAQAFLAAGGEAPRLSGGRIHAYVQPSHSDSQ